MTTLVFGTVLSWVLLAFGMWLGYQLVRQNGRILLRHVLRGGRVL